MFKSEFINYTHYEPEVITDEHGEVTYDEFDFIQLSWYDSSIEDHKEFCEDWLKKYYLGYWKDELELRKSHRDDIKDLQQSLEKEYQHAERYRDLYHAEYQKVQELLEDIKSLTSIIQQFQFSSDKILNNLHINDDSDESNDFVTLR